MGECLIKVRACFQILSLSKASPGSDSPTTDLHTHTHTCTHTVPHMRICIHPSHTLTYTPSHTVTHIHLPCAHILIHCPKHTPVTCTHIHSCTHPFITLTHIHVHTLASHTQTPAAPAWGSVQLRGPSLPWSTQHSRWFLFHSHLIPGCSLSFNPC